MMRPPFGSTHARQYEARSAYVVADRELHMPGLTCVRPCGWDCAADWLAILGPFGPIITEAKLGFDMSTGLRTWVEWQTKKTVRGG